MLTLHQTSTGKPAFTLDEFKAWFEGFNEAVGDAPTPDQWAKIKAKVAEISLPGPVFRSRGPLSPQDIDDFKRAWQTEEGEPWRPKYPPIATLRTEPVPDDISLGDLVG